MTKRELRAELLEKRSLIDPSDRAFFDRLIFDRAHKLRAFQLASSIHIYRNLPEEVETMPFLEYAWSTGKDVYVPVVPPGGTQIISVRVTYATQWTTGSYGISMPAVYAPEDVREASSFDASSCILVPVVGFDQSCNRLGYGKGFYDRFLGATSGAPAIGLAYECQRCAAIPRDDHDMRLSAVATEYHLDVA
jgi:5-formyltetrahydrofolate cyclo-ligase